MILVLKKDEEYDAILIQSPIQKNGDSAFTVLSSFISNFSSEGIEDKPFRGGFIVRRRGA